MPGTPPASRDFPLSPPARWNRWHTSSGTPSSPAWPAFPACPGRRTARSRSPAASCWNSAAAAATTSSGSPRTPPSGPRTTSASAASGPSRPSRRSPAAWPATTSPRTASTSAATSTPPASTARTPWTSCTTLCSAGPGGPRHRHSPRNPSQNPRHPSPCVNGLNAYDDLCQDAQLVGVCGGNPGANHRLYPCFTFDVAVCHLPPGHGGDDASDLAHADRLGAGQRVRSARVSIRVGESRCCHGGDVVDVDERLQSVTGRQCDHALDGIQEAFAEVLHEPSGTQYGMG